MDVKVTQVAEPKAVFDLLGLSPEEIATLYLILVGVGGNPQTTIRKFSEPIAMKLRPLVGDTSAYGLTRSYGEQGPYLRENFDGKPVWNTMIANLNSRQG